MDADTIAGNAAKPASAAVDGRQAAQVPIGDQIKAAQFQATSEGLAGTNDNGGPKSGWGRTRTARAASNGAV